MTQWTFVLLAYALCGFATVGLIGASFLSMRRAETEAEAVKRRR